jgi:hypothetical protein
VKCFRETKNNLGEASGSHVGDDKDGCLVGRCAV